MQIKNVSAYIFHYEQFAHFTLKSQIVFMQIIYKPIEKVKVHFPIWANKFLGKPLNWRICSDLKE